MSEPKPEDLARCRVQIDALDVELLQLLNRRTAIVEEIGRIKESLALGIYEPKREEQVFANVLSHNRGPLPPEAVKRIFERIIDEMRTVQKTNMKSPESYAPASLEKKSC
jgi:chorismate mutase-like protein